MTESFDQLSLKEIAELISAWGESSQPASELLRMHRRLMHIGFMEHGVSEAESAAAAKLADIIKRSLLGAGSSQLRAKMEEAMTIDKGHLQRFGRGTIMWEQEEAELAARGRSNS